MAAINAAKIGGATKDELKKLVRELHAKRKDIAERYRHIALGETDAAA